VRTLVLEGGGMRNAFTVGVIKQFLENGINYRYFDNYVATSVATWSTLYFLADRFDVGYRLWNKDIPEYFRGRLLNFNEGADYLKKLFKETGPAILTKISARKQKVFVPLTNINTMKTEYFCLNTAKDPLDILLTAVAWPFYFPPTIINGNPYYDGGLTSAIPIEKADMLGSDEKWLILTYPLDYHKRELPYKLGSLFALHKPRLRKLISQRAVLYNQTLREINKREDLIVISPKKNLPNFRKTDLKSIRTTIRLGKQAATEFLKKRNLLKN